MSGSLTFEGGPGGGRQRCDPRGQKLKPTPTTTMGWLASGLKT
jgi:hypothetical protein